MKSFKNHIEEAHSDWHVTFKTGHKPQRVKGRNTAEAIKKAEKRAQNSGEKDSRLKAMYKDIKKVSEEVELDEVLDRPGALDSYRKKADDSGNRARNSATRKILQGPDKDGKRADHSDELKTMKKRNKGQDMADRVANKLFRKSIGKGYAAKKEEAELDEAYRAPTKAEIEADKRKDNAGKKRPSMDSKSANKAMYKNMMGGLKKEETELDEAVGTSAKHAGKTGMFGGKYTSKDHMIGMKNMQSIRKKRQDQRSAEHQKQDPKMAKMGYAKHMLDTDKADAKARKRGIDPTGKYDKYKKKNGIREEVELTEADIAEILRQYALSENVNADQLAELTEEEINEIIGKAIGKVFKLGAKAAVGSARLAKKGAKAASSQGRIDREKKKLAREKEKLAKAKDSRSMFSKQGRENRAKDRAELQKIRDQRKDLAAKRKSGNFNK